MNTEPIVFESIARLEIPTTIGGANYILTEADGDAVTRYRSASIKGVELVMGEDGTRTSKHLDLISEVEPLLVSRCLYTPDPATNGLHLDKEGNPDNKYLVSIGIIKRWPAKIQKYLFERIKEISDLNEEDDIKALEKQIAKLQEKVARIKAREEETKNSSSTTPDGSV